MPFQMPPLNLNLNMNNRSGDISGGTGYGESVLDGSGWTVNYRTAGNATGATQTRPSVFESSTAKAGGIPWVLIIGGLVAWKIAKN
jgi:hypothetical protein